MPMMAVAITDTAKIQAGRVNTALLVLDEEFRELLPQRTDLGLVVDDDVRLERMVEEVALVISLGVVEPLQLRDLGDDLAAKHFRGVELLDVRPGDTPLRVVGVED